MPARLIAALVLAPVFSVAQAQLPEARFIRVEFTFSRAGIPPAEVRQVVKQIGSTSFDMPNSWDDELRVRRMALGEADVLVVRGTTLLCGGTGNCQTWVFLRAKAQWRSLIAGDAPLASGLGFEDVDKGALKNLVLVANAGGQKDRYTRYRYDGRNYRPIDCFDVESLDNSSAEPKVTKIACAP
jgi:hypothetical protein